MKTEIQDHANFDAVRYANCWEDADILMQAMQPNRRRDEPCSNSLYQITYGSLQGTITS